MRRIEDISLSEARVNFDHEDGKAGTLQAMLATINLKNGKTDKPTQKAYVEGCLIAFANGVYFGRLFAAIHDAMINKDLAYVHNNWGALFTPTKDYPGGFDLDFQETAYDQSQREIAQTALKDVQTNFRLLDRDDMRIPSHRLIYLGEMALLAFRGGLSVATILASLD